MSEFTSASSTPTFKLLLMGDSGVGKSSILLRFVEDRFLGEDVHAATIEGQKVKLTIWDTAGQERFRTLTSSYYRGAHGVILVYDVCNRESFEAIRNVWLHELTVYTSTEEMILMIVANKVDKTGTRKISKEEGEEFAKGLSALYMECSAKTKLGIMAAFEELVHTILHSPKLVTARREADQSASKRLQVTREKEDPSTESSCAC